jgi:PAS domain S-box-containing protein
LNGGRKGQLNSKEISYFHIVTLNHLQLKISQQTGSYPFLQGGGEMGELTRQYDWAGTIVGSPGEWPQSLKTTVSNLLRSKFPMFLWWGEDMIQFYNDAYRPSMGNEGKHPSALGAKGPETWPEIWPIISPLMRQVQTTGEATWMENQLVPIYRNGKIEDVYWTYSYSSVLDDDGNHNGILVTCMETTETVIAHKKIEESQQDLLLLFDKSPVAIAKISKEDDLVFEFANSFYGVLVGRKPSEIIGKPLLEAIPEIKRQGFDEILKEVIRTGNPFLANELAVDIYRENRLETIYIDLVYQPWTNREGSIDGVLVVATDVTVQVLARKKVEESEERFRIMADMSPNLIWMLNPDGSYKYVNKTTLHFLNITQEKIADVGWAPFLHPDDTETATAAVTKAVEYQEPYEMEHRLRYKDGTYRWVFSQALPAFDADGKVYAFVGSSIDIHEKRQMEIDLRNSEARFRNMIEQAPVAIALTRGEDYVFESINPLMLQVIHKKDAQDVLGRGLREVLPELLDQPVFTILQQVLHTGDTFRGTEVEVELAKDGVLQRGYFNITYTRMVDKNGVSSVLHVSTDVTDQVLSRRKIEESEAKLRSILNSAPTAMGVLVGPDLIIENPNQLLIEVLAAGPDIEGKSFRKLLSGLVEDDQKFIGVVDTVRTTGEPFEAKEVEVFFKAEKMTRYFNISFIPLRDENETVYAVLDVSVDVTEQVLASHRLAASETKFRSLIQEAPFATALYLGPELKIDTINEAMLQLWDKPASVVGKTFEEALPELPHQPFTALLKNVYATGIEYEARGEPADIMIRGHMQRGWYNFNYKPIRNENGDIYGIVHMAVDVTEQVLAQKKIEENEAALSRALEQVRLSKEAAELGTFDMDLETGTMHWDKRCRNLFGISHDLPVSFNQDFIPGLHPDDQKRVETVVQHSFDKSLSNGDYDIEYRTIGAKDGVIRWVRAKGKVYFNSNENPVRFIGSVLDISDQVMAIQKIESLVEERTKELAEANNSLKVINKELQRSNQNLEEFAHAASHDLKEPVRKITYFTQQLKDQLGDRLKESESRSFTRIVNATERMGHLIDDLLLYSHVSHRPQETETVDLNEKLQRVLEDLELDIQEKNAVIHVGKLPVVNGYRRQLQQLLQNLISNALKYSKADEPPQIDIIANRSWEGEQQYTVISVKDNGIGFEPEYSDKIFQMFSRLHGKHEYSGTGVGLSIVKKVVENHEGFISVESEPGQGSTFNIYLPV